MSDDSPIVAEVRRIRHQIAEECGHDLRKITEHALKAAKEFLAANEHAKGECVASA